MSDLIEDLTHATISRALSDGPRMPILRQLIRTAGRMLAESHGHDLVADIHAAEVRSHVEAKNRQGVQRGRGGR